MSLKAVLERHNITAADLRRATVQGGRRKGVPLSAAAISRLINQHEFPRETAREEVQKQIREFLAGRGVPASDLAKLWTPVAASVHGDQGQTPHNHEEVTMLPEAQRLTTQARKFFNLKRDPFQDDIQAVEDVYLSASAYEAMEAMQEALQFAQFSALIGESGSGKSTLRELFEEKHRGRKVNIIRPYITDMAESEKHGRAVKSGQIHEAIITRLSPGAKIPRTPEARQARAHQLLCKAAEDGYQNLLVIEEAHDLPLQTLKHLKRFWELKDGMKRVLGILLIGQPELQQTLTIRISWEAREVIQRCAVTMLKPLAEEELEEYLAHKLGRIGAAPNTILASDAYDGIREQLQRRVGKGATAEEVSELYPLAIGNLLTRALNLCGTIGFPQVSAEQRRNGGRGERVVSPGDWQPADAGTQSVRNDWFPAGERGADRYGGKGGVR
jgi:type II secretory pathway predicted ATPase ExeA